MNPIMRDVVLDTLYRANELLSEGRMHEALGVFNEANAIFDLDRTIRRTEEVLQ